MVRDAEPATHVGNRAPVHPLMSGSQVPGYPGLNTRRVLGPTRTRTGSKMSA